MERRKRAPWSGVLRSMRKADRSARDQKPTGVFGSRSEPLVNPTPSRSPRRRRSAKRPGEAHFKSTGSCAVAHSVARAGTGRYQTSCSVRFNAPKIPQVSDPGNSPVGHESPAVDSKWSRVRWRRGADSVPCTQNPSPDLSTPANLR